MKNCAEIIKKLGSRNKRLTFATTPSEMIRWIAEIQQDAWKQGVKDASKVCEINWWCSAKTVIEKLAELSRKT